MMTILVSGGAGFVGLNVVEALLARGERVVLLDRGALPPGAQRISARHADQLTIAAVDVLDAQALADAVSQHRVARIVHCAAITSGPQREAQDPASIVDVNLRGTINMLAAARRAKVKRVLYVSSGAVYGESLYKLPQVDEDSPALPLTMYAATKFAAERTCLRLRELWQLDVVCARLGTVIGPWERDTGVRDNYGTHTQLAGMAVAGRTAILTPREVRRDWVYSRDVAAGLVALLEAAQPRHMVYNLSSGMDWEQPVRAWCEALKAAFSGFDYRVAAEGEQPNIWYTDRDRCNMNVARIAHDIGFAARHDAHAAYAGFIEWIKQTPEFWRAA
jgi:nucleoside-diphosphate-sugar epimerase